MVGSYLFVLRRRLPFILCLTAVVAPLLFQVLQSRPAEYASSAVIQVGTGTVAEQVIGQQRSYEEPERRVATQADAVTSRPVAELVAERLGAAAAGLSTDDLVRRITATPRPATDYVDVTGVGPTARGAQEITQAFTTAFLDYRRSLQQRELERLERDLVQQRRDAEATLAELPAGPGADRDRDVLTGRIDNAVRLVEAVRLRMSIDQIGVELLSSPSLPEQPSNGVSARLAVLASLLAAALMGICLAFLIDLLRDGVRTRREAEQVTGAPVIATVEHPRTRSSRRPSSRTEARALRLGLAAACGGVLPTRTMILAVSGEADEARDVAGLLAQGCHDGGLRAVVFADTTGDSMPAPAVTPASGEVVLVLAGAVGVRESREPGIWVGSAAGAGGDGALFDVPAPASALDEAAREFDAVVVVVEPGQGVDPQAVHHLFDAVVIVCRLGRTPSRRLKSLTERLRHGHRPVNATVLTARPRRPDRRRVGRDAAAAAPAATWDPMSTAVSSRVLSSSERRRGDA